MRVCVYVCARVRGTKSNGMLETKHLARAWGRHSIKTIEYINIYTYKYLPYCVVGQPRHRACIG